MERLIKAQYNKPWKLRFEELTSYDDYQGDRVRETTIKVYDKKTGKLMDTWENNDWEPEDEPYWTYTSNATSLSLTIEL